jgi:hypothetical protein
MAYEYVRPSGLRNRGSLVFSAYEEQDPDDGKDQKDGQDDPDHNGIARKQKMAQQSDAGQHGENGL